MDYCWWCVLLHTLLLLQFASLCSCSPVCDSEVYCDGDLLLSVQIENIFSDSKLFVDMPMKDDPAVIVKAFSNWTKQDPNGLLMFVSQWFLEAGSDLQQWTPTDWSNRPAFLDKIRDPRFQNMATDINKLWTQLGRQLTRDVKSNPQRHSLLDVPYPFIVPGGNLRELHYWDTYWIIQGLLVCDMKDTARGMILNLASLVDRYGLVPSGGRVYYTRRSNPPLLTQMVSLYYSATNDTSFVEQLLPTLDKEYQFWMSNRTAQVSPHMCCVNKYNVNASVPRPEAYLLDWTVSELFTYVNESTKFYGSVATAAESGWDFSTRWFKNGSLTSIRTEQIVPVDLNAILCENERTLEQLHQLTGSPSQASLYRSAWTKRKEVFDELFWNEQAGLWQDWDLDSNSNLGGFYASTFIPLLWGCGPANLTRHLAVWKTLKENGVLDYPGGIPTSKNISGQQWDFPLVWAPLHWFLVVGWHNSSSLELRNTSRSVALTWINSIYIGWNTSNNTMYDKYICEVVGVPIDRSKHNLQNGFGWTNGVALHYLHLYPDLASPPSLGWIAAIIVPLVLVALGTVATFLCILWARRLYQTGKNRYWSRVRDSHRLHSSSSSPPPASKEETSTVIENPIVFEEEPPTSNDDIPPSLSSSFSTDTSPEHLSSSNTSNSFKSQLMMKSRREFSRRVIIVNPVADDEEEDTATISGSSNPQQYTVEV